MAVSAARKGTVATYPLTDWGNSLRLLQNLPQWRYAPHLKSWLQWDGMRWVRDQDGLLLHEACALGRWIAAEAAKADEGKRPKIYQWAVKSEGSDRISAAIRLATSHPDFVVKEGALDADPFLLNTLSGTVHLRLLRGDPDAVIDPWAPDREAKLDCAHVPHLLSHMESDGLTHLAPFRVDMEEPPLWMEFLDNATNGNTLLQTYLQRAVGYSLSGDTSEKCVFVLYGPSNTGKSTFLETLRTILGDYASRMSTETLLSGRNGQAGAAAMYDLARLSGVRFVTASEPSERSTLAEGIIKDFTGNETITARHPYGRPFNFRPQFKLWISTNTKPAIQDASGAIWRRIRMIPFLHVFDGKRRGSTVERELLAEAPGILGWAIKGFEEWSRYGLGEPAIVGEMTEEYRMEMDPIAQFFDDRVEQNPHASIGASNLYRAYCQWAKEEGESVCTGTRFGIRVRSMGIQRIRKNSGKYYQGVTVRDEQVDG